MIEHNAQTEGQKRLLIVDDDIQSIRLLSSIVEELGEVYFATSGEDALRQIRDCAPDLVLLDAEMAGMDGFQTCSAIKKIPIGADIPIIFVTVHSDTEAETRALARGAVDFISKPVNAAVVLARVKTHLALKRKSDQLRRLGSIDGLTGIANRRTFEYTLSNEWFRCLRSNSPLSLLLIDVDFFKHYNDTYGHPAGDACLQTMAAELAALARRTSDLVARYGGEEFSMLLPQTGAADAKALAQQLLARVIQLAIPHSQSQVAPYVTLSIGVATAQPPCQLYHQMSKPCKECAVLDCCMSAAKDLVEHADKALYLAKHEGRARVVSRTCVFSMPTTGFAEAGVNKVSTMAMDND